MIKSEFNYIFFTSFKRVKRECLVANFWWAAHLILPIPGSINLAINFCGYFMCNILNPAPIWVNHYFWARKEIICSFIFLLSSASLLTTVYGISYKTVFFFSLSKALFIQKHCIAVFVCFDGPCWYVPILKCWVLLSVLFVFSQGFRHGHVQ